MRGQGVAACTVAVLLGGCYSPAPRSGSYLCAEDRSCPTGLSCSGCAGLCVGRDSDDVCALRITLDSPPPCSPAIADACVREQGDLAITVTALAAGGAPSTFSGPGTLASSWGHARPQPRRESDPFAFHLEGGVAHLTVRLDRATPANGTAQLRARVGHTEGVALQSIIVDPRPFRDPESILAPGASDWADGYLGFPAVDRTPAGEYRMYVSGVGNPLARTPRARIGVATSPSGKPGSWALGVTPLLGSDDTHLFAPTTLRLRDGSVRLFTTVYDLDKGGNVLGAGAVKVATAADGVTFGKLEPALTVAACPFCDPGGGLLYPWALTAPGDAGEWLVFFSTAPRDRTGTSVGVARTVDAGGSWHLAPVPSPSSGQAAAGLQLALMPRVVYDRADGIYRMWYAEIADPTALVPDACRTNVGYATSEDGLFWSGSRTVVLSLSDVKWAPGASTGLYPGAVLPSDGADGGAADGSRWQVYFSPMVRLLTLCLPVGVGRATDG